MPFTYSFAALSREMWLKNEGKMFLFRHPKKIPYISISEIPDIKVNSPATNGEFDACENVPFSTFELFKFEHISVDVKLKNGFLLKTNSERKVKFLERIGIISQRSRGDATQPN